MKNECYHHVKESQTFCKARERGVLTVMPRKRCLTEERREFFFGHNAQTIATKLIRMRYLRNVWHLEYKIWSNYNAYTPNASDQLEYRVIKSVHVGVKLMYDHGRSRNRDVTQ